MPILMQCWHRSTCVYNRPWYLFPHFMLGDFLCVQKCVYHFLYLDIVSQFHEFPSSERIKKVLKMPHNFSIERVFFLPWTLPPAFYLISNGHHLILALQNTVLNSYITVKQFLKIHFGDISFDVTLVNMSNISIGFTIWQTIYDQWNIHEGIVYSYLNLCS